MMPVCGFKTSRITRCNATADKKIGRIILPGTIINGEPWTQDHWLCAKHANKFLELIGYGNHRHDD